MGLRAAAFAFCLSASAALASPETDRLVDAMGIPALIAAFSMDGIANSHAINDGVLNGQGGAIWAETVSRLYDPARLEQEVRSSFAEALDDQIAAQALLFFESELGARIIDLEVQARNAMLNPELEAAAKASPAAQSEALTHFLEVRNLVDRNTDAALEAQVAFFAGIAATAPQAAPVPDSDAQRALIRVDTERWLRGYYALAQSPLNEDDVAIYTAFWDTEVATELDDALFAAFGTSYSTLSFGLGQAAGRLLPQNDL
ncbi:DUF2059 domain-containing protein [uncultured Tateyamaria sp.]|uniref:DUF2059 domain-containing protein n=1 Tax=uncultured Tateyamaria sp. TaxID=455651 RepID=UPI002619A3A0|nr:DUF2059 domain-containing protein [uncultured Tateyamaria sp.]